MEQQAIPEDLVEVAVLVEKGPKFPIFCTITKRIQSFQAILHQTFPDPFRMADAEFFYTGTLDLAVCFYCGISLYEWTELDDPWEEHEHNSPSCAYYVLNNHRQYDSPVTVGDNAEPPIVHEQETGITKVNFSLQNVIHEEKSERIVALEEEISKLKHLVVCKICLSEIASYLYAPCCHLATCLSCSTSQLKCLICRSEIELIMKVYL